MYLANGDPQAEVAVSSYEERRMPWKTKDAKRHTKKAKSPKRKRQWSKVANKVLAESGDEGKAIRIANGAVKKAGHKHGKKKSKKRGTKR